MFLIILLSFRNGARHHVHLVPSLLVPAIMSILFFFSWGPPSCQRFIPVWCPPWCQRCFPSPVLVHATISILYCLSWYPPSFQHSFTCLGAHHVKSTLCPETWSSSSCPLCVPRLCSIMSRLRLLSWCPPSSKPYLPALMTIFRSNLGPQLGFRHYANLVSTVLAPVIMFTLCPYLGTRYRVLLVSPSWRPLPS